MLDLCIGFKWCMILYVAWDWCPLLVEIESQVDRIYQSSHTILVHLATIYDDTLDYTYSYLTNNPSHDDSHCTHHMLLEGDMNLGPTSNMYSRWRRVMRERRGCFSGWDTNRWGLTSSPGHESSDKYHSRDWRTLWPCQLSHPHAQWTCKVFTSVWCTWYQWAYVCRYT